MYQNTFFSILNIKNSQDLKKFSKKSGVKSKTLAYYNNESILPSNKDFERIVDCLQITETEFKLKMGFLDNKLKTLLSEHANEIDKIISSNKSSNNVVNLDFIPSFSTDLGNLYQSDSLELIKSIPKESVDLIFADPPFNLNKMYESGINDKLTKEEYIKWTEEWVVGCIDLLKEGGSFFIWNIPLWNTYTAEIMNKHLKLRNWIAVDIKYSLPIPNKLYPSHYSLLYYTKGEKPNTFNQEHLPLEICRHCGGDIKDYGGYKDKLNLLGMSLTDVWKDISPVRHVKYKTRVSNELPLNLLERIISIASKEGDTVFDPFGGSGTTYIVSEVLNRKWIGSEIGPVETIIERFKKIEKFEDQIQKIRKQKNVLFTDKAKKIRLKNGHWLPKECNVCEKKV